MDFIWTLALIVGALWVLYRLKSDFQLRTLERVWYDKTEKKLFALGCQADNARHVSALMRPLHNVRVCKFAVDPKLFEHAMTLSEEDRKFLSEVFTEEGLDGRVPKQFQVTVEVWYRSKRVILFTTPDPPYFPEKVTTTYSNTEQEDPSHDVLDGDSIWDVQLPNKKVIRLLFYKTYLKLIVDSWGRDGFEYDSENEIFEIPITQKKTHVTDKGAEDEDLLSKYYQPRLSDPPHCMGYVHEEEGLWWFLELQDYWVRKGKVLLIHDFDPQYDFYSDSAFSKCDRIAQVEVIFAGDRIWLPFSTENPLEEGQRILVRVDYRGWLEWEPFPDKVLGKWDMIALDEEANA